MTLILILFSYLRYINIGLGCWNAASAVCSEARVEFNTKGFLIQILLLHKVRGMWSQRQDKPQSMLSANCSANPIHVNLKSFYDCSLYSRSRKHWKNLRGLIYLKEVLFLRKGELGIFLQPICSTAFTALSFIIIEIPHQWTHNILQIVYL